MHSPNVALPLVMPVVGPTVTVVTAFAVPPRPLSRLPEPVPIAVLVPFVDGDELEKCAVWGWGLDRCEVRFTPTAAAAVAKPTAPTIDAAAILNGMSFLRMGISFSGDGPADTMAAAAETTFASRLSSSPTAEARAACTSPATPA